MEGYDEQILEAQREMERRNYTTLETGIYVDDSLETFSMHTLPDTRIQVYLPDSFVILPERVRAVKYPYRDSPDYIYTSLSGTVNLGFNLLPEVLKEGDTQVMSSQSQRGLTNLNPGIKIRNPGNGETRQGNEMSWFEFKGNSLDGQSFNRMYFIRMHKIVLHGVFTCIAREKDRWDRIVAQIFDAVEEEL